MTNFPKFGRYVDNCDSVTVDVDGFTCTARLYLDDCQDKPDERDCAFWPSLNPKSAGYIGPKSPRTLRRHHAKARAIMDAWLNDEWHYYGVAVTVARNGVELVGRYDYACWGIEGNYPGSDNSYLSTVADELLWEALADARAKIKLLTEED